MSWRAQTSAAELRPLFASFLYILEKVGAVSLIVGTVHSCAPTPLPFIALNRSTPARPRPLHIIDRRSALTSANGRSDRVPGESRMLG